ncbi:MAG: hypothetical protein IPJ19_12255 [Planctomycetes bacterium]|nr:hypothetical protein [Planctomycetota bacterium]
MRLLRPDELPEVPSERVLRHSAVGAFVLLALIAAPVFGAALCWSTLMQSLHPLPWFLWIIAGPLALLAGLLWLLVLQAARASAQAALLPSNWLLRVGGSGLAIQLRSFRNFHFRKDVPTILWLEASEVSRVRRVRESRSSADAHDRSRVYSYRIEIELAGVDTTPIAERLAAEQKDPGPRQRFLGIPYNSRFNETPVIVARPGVLQLEYLGRRMLRTLGTLVEVAPDREVDLDRDLGGALEQRVQALCERGMRLDAVALLRHERGMSLTQAKLFTDRFVKQAA